jgi:hypothetical protein
MKAGRGQIIMNIFRRILIGAVMVALTGGLSAQESISTSAAITDTKELLDILGQTTPIAYDTLSKTKLGRPAFGTFWSFQNRAWPPLPCNSLGLDVWPLGDGVYVLDDRNVDYAALRAAADLEQSLFTMESSSMMLMMSTLSSTYAYGNTVYLTNLTTTAWPMSASFDIGGGTNNVPYDILTTTNLALPKMDWNWIGIGYTSNRYTLSNQPADMAFYMLAKPQKTMTVSWGGDAYGQSDVPLGSNNLLMASAAYGYNLGVLTNGTVIGWGNSSVAGWVPTNLVGNVAMVAAAWNHNVALLTNGTVTAWGFNGAAFGWHLTEVPADLTNATVISAQGLHSLALRKDGTVVAWGYNINGQTNVPAGLTNITAIAAGGNHSLAVSNGFVIAWGNNNYGQCNVPSGLSNVWDVAASDYHSLALRNDGTVAVWGDNAYGESTVPPGLSNVVAIAAGGSPNVNDAYMGRALPYNLALKKDGTVTAWGAGLVPQPVQGLNNVVGISGGLFHGVAIRTGPPTPVITLEPTNQYQVAGGNVTFTAKGQGLYGVTYQWQTNGVNLLGATNATLALTNVQTAQTNDYCLVVTDNAGMGNIMSSNASLGLVVPPVLVSQAPMPTNQVVPFQTNLTLSVTATPTEQFNGFPLFYQWLLNGTNISGANSNIFTFLVDSPSLGAYSVVVTNLAGSVTSLVWQVSMTYTGSYIDVGTLAYHLSTNAVGRTNGFASIYSAQFELSGWIYDTYSGTNMAHLTNAIWSTNFWLKGVQGLSATSIGFSNCLGAQGSVTMISPRHCIYANHMHWPPGYFMAAFLDTNNVVHWRTNMQNLNFGGDTSVGILDSDLPASVGFIPVLPTNYVDYLPINGSIVQGIGRNQGVRMYGLPAQMGLSGVSWNYQNADPFGLTTNWNVSTRPGDSSNPIMLLVDNQLVLISHHGSYGGGPNYSGQFEAINQTMHYLSTNNNAGTDYQLSPISLTNWPAIR